MACRISRTDGFLKSKIGLAQLPRLVSKWLSSWVLASAARFAGYVVSFASQVVLARALGKEAFGVYVYVLTVATFVALISRMGLDQSAVRELPRFIARGDPCDARTFAWFSLTAPAVLATTMGLTAFLIVFHVEEWPFGASLAFATVLTALLSLSGTNQQLAFALRSPVTGQIVDGVVRPMGMVVFVLALWWFVGEQLDVAQGLGAHVLAALTAVLFGMFIVLKNLPAAGDSVSWREIPWITWTRNSSYFLFIALFNLVVTESDRLMIGWMQGLEDVGVYHAASRLAVVVAFGITVASAIAAPKFAAAFERNDRPALVAALREARLSSVPIGVVVALLLFVWGSEVLGLFGSEFRQGLTVLRVLVAGQVSIILFGPVSHLLTMTGHQQAAMKAIGTAAVLNVLLNGLLIPALGTLGAAIGSSVSVVLWNAWMYLLVRRRVLT